MDHYHPPRPCPPRPAPPQGFLMQKIVVCEKRSIPCLCTDLCLSACNLTALKSVSSSGTPPCAAADGCTLRITLLLNVCACDACGHGCVLPTSIDVETSLPHGFLRAMEDARSTLLILPCVRLIHADCMGNGCFRVQLHVTLEIYLLRYEACMCGAPKPQCPQLPLYPPPIC